MESIFSNQWRCSYFLHNLWFCVTYDSQTSGDATSLEYVRSFRCMHGSISWPAVPDLFQGGQSTWAFLELPPSSSSMLTERYRRFAAAQAPQRRQSTSRRTTSCEAIACGMQRSMMRGHVMWSLINSQPRCSTMLWSGRTIIFGWGNYDLCACCQTTSDI